MKKQDIVNLIRYHIDNNDQAFRDEAYNIAREFDDNGDSILSDYIVGLLSSADDSFVPQATYNNLKYLTKIRYSDKSLYLPESIQNDVIGIINATRKNMGINKFLFSGAPGTGKTETAKQIARILQRDLLVANFDSLIDSRLGQTAKNLSSLFEEINHLNFNKVVVVFDEVDSIAMNRINSNDLREMGRVTSTFVRELDELNPKILLIATTNLYKAFDKALLRRFDAIIDFNRYTKNDLIQIADKLLDDSLKKTSASKKDIRLFNKILASSQNIPYPGELKNLIKISLAFSGDDNEYDYLKKIYLALNDQKVDNVETLFAKGFTTRETEILTNISKSQVSRILKGEANE